MIQGDLCHFGQLYCVLEWICGTSCLSFEVQPICLNDLIG